MSAIVNRRRYMGKSGYIEWLKSLGCICWLPLSSDGDMLDRISGESLELTGNGSMVWDGAKGMYHFTTPASKSQYVAFLDNGMNASSFPDDEFTTIVTLEKITDSNVRYFNGAMTPISNVDATQVSMMPAHNGTGRTSSWPTGVQKLAKVQSSDRAYVIYYNGSLNVSGNSSSGYMPSEWSVISNGLCVCTARNSGAITTNVQVYIKNIYIFNKALTLEDIRKIQGYV